MDELKRIFRVFAENDLCPPPLAHEIHEHIDQLVKDVARMQRAVDQWKLYKHQERGVKRPRESE